MYISHCMTAACYKLQNPWPIDGNIRAETTKRKLRSLQYQTLEHARPTAPGQTSVRRRIVDCDQRCASCDRFEYCEARQSSVQTETNGKRNAGRYIATTSPADS